MDFLSFSNYFKVLDLDGEMGAARQAKIIGKLEKPKENLKNLEIIGKNWKIEGFSILLCKTIDNIKVFQRFQ